MLIKKYKATGMIADRIRPPVKSKKLELEHLCLIGREALDTDNENRIFICTAIQVCFVYKGTCIRAYAYTHAAVRVFSHVFVVTTK